MEVILVLSKTIVKNHITFVCQLQGTSSSLMLKPNCQRVNFYYHRKEKKMESAHCILSHKDVHVFIVPRSQAEVFRMILLLIQ